VKDAGGTAGAARAGTVYLVGGGPGDPGLMTLRGAELIASADAILYDRLIPDSALRDVQGDALLEFAGKGPSGDSKLQPDIEARMIELAKAGKSVVRLKGGDPFVFGRGGEEAATMAAAGIPFEIVPGVTAGVAAAAYAGVPVTHRDHAAAVAFITGHEDPLKPESTIDWPALAKFPGTLVFYMGVKNLPRISAQLIENGRDASEPVAVIAQGTTPVQKTVTGSLSEIPDLVANSGINPPALTVIGSVVEERERIEWFENRPLFGRTVAVTRARAQASKLSAQLRELGAAVIEAPSIRTEVRDDADVRAATASASGSGIIAFTSANGVDAFFEALARDGRDARALPGVRMAAVGGATAEALKKHGVIADLVPERSTAEGLLELLAEDDLNGVRILLAVAANARPVLGAGLRDRGATVTEVAYYDTIAEELDDEAAAAITEADFITFASGSAVHSLAKSLGGTDDIVSANLISIGPNTTEAMLEHGLEATAEAETSDLDGLIAALLTLV
jgi:uroporphyrinogen III methyltransferase/synthase